MDRKDSGAALKGLCLLALLAVSACKGKDPEPGPAPQLQSGAVLVGCEGNFGSGNAELTLYAPSSGGATAAAYEAANGGRLGDVLQSITLLDERLLLCVNNSDKLVAVNKATLSAIGSVAVPKPRYVLPVAAGKAYVSSLYGNKLYVLNTQRLQLDGSIELPRQNPEGMLLNGSRAWVACWDTACRALYGVDAATNSVADSIALPGAAPQSLAEDAEGKIWVLSGNVYKGKTAHLVRIDPVSRTVLTDYTFGAGVDPLRLCTNPGKDTLYFLEVDYNNSGPNPGGGVFRMNIHSAGLPQQAFVPALSNQYFYGLGIDPVSGSIYVGDPKGFLMRGAVNVFNPQGQLLTSFTTSVGPSSFYFQP